MKKNTALLVLDFINEIVHPDGKYAGDGYVEQISKHRILENTASAIWHARALGMPVIYVVVGFSESYAEWPSRSPVFSKAKADRRIILGTWGTEIHALLAPHKDDIVIAKNRISPFFQTNLDLVLRSLGIDTLMLTGVSTEFVVLTTAIDAHDRDYQVIVLEDAVVASHDDLHEAALKIIGRTANVTTVAHAFSHAQAA